MSSLKILNIQCFLCLCMCLCAYKYVWVWVCACNMIVDSTLVIFAWFNEAHKDVDMTRTHKSSAKYVCILKYPLTHLLYLKK